MFDFSDSLPRQARWTIVSLKTIFGAHRVGTYDFAEKTLNPFIDQIYEPVKQPDKLRTARFRLLTTSPCRVALLQLRLQINILARGIVL